MAGTGARLLPSTTRLRFAANPSGLTLTFNGANATAPFTRTVIVNSTNSVSAPSPQNLRGIGKQVFKSLSDDPGTDPDPPTREIVAESAATYTANFARK